MMRRHHSVFHFVESLTLMIAFDCIGGDDGSSIDFETIFSFEPIPGGYAHVVRDSRRVLGRVSRIQNSFRDPPRGRTYTFEFGWLLAGTDIGCPLAEMHDNATHNASSIDSVGASHAARCGRSCMGQILVFSKGVGISAQTSPSA